MGYVLGVLENPISSIIGGFMIKECKMAINDIRRYFIDCP